MSLKTQIEADMKKAMLAKEKDELRALRSIKSMIMLAETEHSKGESIGEEKEIQLLTKAAKQRRDAADLYREQNRTDLAEIEEQELSVIDRYLPQQLSEEELKAALQKIIDELGASSPKDMGKVMGSATQQLAGKADGKLIASTVKSLLST